MNQYFQDSINEFHRLLDPEYDEFTNAVESIVSDEYFLKNMLSYIINWVIDSSDIENGESILPWDYDVDKDVVLSEIANDKEFQRLIDSFKDNLFKSLDNFILDIISTLGDIVEDNLEERY